MTEISDQVQEFHQAFNCPINSTFKDSNLLYLRLNLLREEFKELFDALIAEDRAATAKEMADLAYVLWGTALSFGINLDEAIKRVHQSNMSKLDENGDPILREDGKILKGPFYKEPDLNDL